MCNQEVKDRIAGRIEAEQMIEMLQTSEKSPAWQQGFFRELHRASIASGDVTIERLKVMDDEQAKRFEKKTIDFGTHRGIEYRSVPITYLTWLADSVLNLQAYLRSERGQKRIEKET